jgi:hypothetical protein
MEETQRSSRHLHNAIECLQSDHISVISILSYLLNKALLFLYFNFRRVLNVACNLLGCSPACGV